MSRHNGRGGWSTRRGPEAIFWCDNCSVPLLDTSCGSCGGCGREVQLSPPGDVRPALKEGAALVRRVIKRDHDVNFPESKGIILFNKIAGLDRTDQLIIDGHIFGTLAFDPVGREFFFSLTAAGASMLLDAGAPHAEFARGQGGRHIKGKCLPLAEFRFPTELAEKSDIIIALGTTVAVGKRQNDGIRIRDIGRTDVRFSTKASTLEAAVKANTRALAALEQRAAQDIIRVANDIRKPLTVSFSGGKDSLAALEVAKRAASKLGSPLTLLFSNTGLEYPETEDFVRQVARTHKLRLLEGSAGNSFWENLPSFGPPAKDFRWCCKVCKLAPMTALITRNFQGGCLTVEGRRRRESFARQNIKLVEESPFVALQTNVEPIRDWTALEVWLYILWKKQPYNPLYDEDLERIGCWLCPATLESEFETLKRIHPELHDRWMGHIVEDGKKRGMDEKALRLGSWRWRDPPPKLIELAREKGIRLQAAKEQGPELGAITGLSPCITGGHSLEATLRFTGTLPLARVANLLWTLGYVRYSEHLGVAVVRKGELSGKIFESGQMVVTGPRPAAVRSFLRDIIGVALRVRQCSRCRNCERACPSGAIKVTDSPVVDEAKCVRCLKCCDGCVLLHYADKLVKGIRELERDGKAKPL